jgi:hypothetical protein
MVRPIVPPLHHDIIQSQLWYVHMQKNRLVNHKYSQIKLHKNVWTIEQHTHCDYWSIPDCKSIPEYKSDQSQVNQITNNLVSTWKNKI